MNERKLSTKLVFATIGVILLSIGLTISVAVNWGVSILDTATLAVQELLNIDKFGDAALLLHFIFFALLLIFKKKLNVRFIDIGFSVASIFILTRVINVFSFVGDYFNYDNFTTTLIIFISSVLVFNIGIYFMVKSNLLISPYDRFILQVAWTINKEYGTTRVYVDVGLFAVTLLLIFLMKLPVTISIGTLYIIFTSGLQINLIGKIFRIPDSH